MDRATFLAAAAREFGHHTAERMAEKRYGPDDPATVERNARVREKEEQAAVTKLFRTHGFTVRSTSQARPSKIALGFPDLFVTHRSKPLAFFWETKRQVGGVLSDAQRDFAADCARCGIVCHAGDRYHAAAFLRSEGFTVP